MYRAAVEEVPVGDYEGMNRNIMCESTRVNYSYIGVSRFAASNYFSVELGQAEILRQGSDVTVVGWGGHLRVLEKTCDMALERYGIQCELIDLQTIVPWDVECVTQSVMRTGKLIVSHEAPITCGFGAEVSAKVQEECFLSLEAPIQRVCGYDTPFPLVFEKYYIPDEFKNLEAIRYVTEFAQ